MKAGRFARRAATLLVVGTGVAFLALTIQRNWSEIGAYDWRARWGQLAASLLLLAVSLVWSAFVWKRVLDRFEGAGTTFRQLLRISFLSKVARYIPGKVWQFVAVGQLSRGAGSPVGVVVSSMLVHAGFVFLSAVFTSSVIVADRVDLLATNPALAVVGLGLLALAASHPKLINVCLRVISTVARRETIRWAGGWRDSVEIFLYSLLSWIADGVAFYLFVDALGHVDPRHVVALIGIHAFAFVTGYVAFVAPAGAGVREATMATMLGRLLPSGAAAVVAILARLWTIAAELLCLAVIMLLLGAKPGEAGTEAEAAAPGRSIE